MIKKILNFIKKTLLWFFAISILSVIIFKWVPVPITPLMVIRVVESKFEDSETIFSHDWEPLENISPNLQKAVIASEDGNFLKHSGFDFDAMQKAFKNNKNNEAFLVCLRFERRNTRFSRFWVRERRACTRANWCSHS